MPKSLIRHQTPDSYHQPAKTISKVVYKSCRSPQALSTINHLEQKATCHVVTFDSPEVNEPAWLLRSVRDGYCKSHRPNKPSVNSTWMRTQDVIDISV